MELLDDVMMRGINAYAKLSYREAPTLFFEFHGTDAWVKEQADITEEIAADCRGQGFQWATSPEDRSKLWHARDNTLYAGLGLRPGTQAMITDASERLLASEKRASLAEEYLATLQGMIRERLEA